LREVEYVALNEHAQIGQQSGFVAEPIELIQRVSADLDLIKRNPSQFDDPQPQPIAALPGVALQETGMLEAGNVAVRGALVQTQPFGHFREAQVWVLGSETSQDETGPLDRLASC
jgi:hypothetical protein